MRYYISHCYNGDKANIEKVGEIAKQLQTKHPEHAYFSPLHAFSFLENADMPFEYLMEIRYDFLSACDVLIVASKRISRTVKAEIDFAKLVKMEVLRLEENGELQPFTE